MALHETSNYSNSSTDTAGQSGDALDPVMPPSSVQFWTLLVFQIPSLACTIFLLYHLLTNRQLRKALHNHVVIILLFLTLCIEIFDNPFYIDAYRVDGHRNSFQITIHICLMWWFLDYGFYGAITVFLAWGSIERHILVFYHRQAFRTSRQRFFIHYLPLILISIYLSGFYIFVIFFPPCETVYDFNSVGCGFNPCYENISYLNAWDYLGNGIVCTIIETMASVALIGRVLWQKRCAHQQVNWQKHRKMTFQLLSISCLSLTIIFPQSLITVIQNVGGPNYSDFGSLFDAYLFYLYNFVVLLLPFICLWNLPELWKKVWLFNRKHRVAVGPFTLLANNRHSIAVRPKPSE